VATATLYPGPVFSYDDPDAPGSFAPATIVGSGNQWADGSDATYATSDGSNPPDTSEPAAYFDPLAMDTLNSASLFVRFSTVADTSGNRGLIFDVFPVERLGTGLSVGFPAVPNDDGIHELTVTLVDGSTTSSKRASYLSAISAGAEIGFVGWTAGPSLTVYETHLIVDYNAPDLSPCYQTLPFAGVLGDGDTGTSLASTESASAFADLAHFTNSQPVTDITVTVQASATSSLSSVPLDVLMRRVSDGSSALRVMGLSIPADGTVRTIVHTVTQAEYVDNGWTGPADLKKPLSDGLTAEFFLDVAVGDTATVTLVEASVQVGHVCVVAPANLRLYPRNNATRLYPRRRTRRPGTF
jgi:hypothetical protein